MSTDYAVSTLNDPELNRMWLEFIRQVRTSVNVHPLLSGYATRLLNDKGDISAEEAQNTLSYYSSIGNAPADMAYWFEGFLRSSGSILLLDDNLWNLVNKLGMFAGKRNLHGTASHTETHVQRVQSRRTPEVG